jgi:hypothetical protein
MYSASALQAAGIAALMIAGCCGSAAGTDTDHSLSFDGVAQYVTIDDPVQITDGPFSLEAWIWMESCVVDGHTILSNRLGVSNGYRLYVWRPGDTPYLSLVLNGGLVAFNPLGATTQEWVHVAATWAGISSGDIKLYANGELLTTYNYTTPIAETPGNLLIGDWGGFTHFHGMIDDVRIWSVALDQQTIQTWMLKPVDASHPNWSSLKAYWKFDEGVGQTVASEVNSPGYDGTLGASSAEEPADPLWTDVVSPVPIEATTLGRLKWSWFLNTR